MEIIRGSLDDISRPASTEQTGSRVSSVSLPHSDRIYPTKPFPLVVLTNDAADNQQVLSSCEETTDSPSDPDKGPHQVDVTDEEDEDFKLQRAIEKMRRLDDILSERLCREREIKRQRRELQSKLWQELLLSKPEGHSECAHEALNTRLFLALEAPAGTGETDDFVPVFETQVPDSDLNRDQNLEQRAQRPNSFTDSFEEGRDETAEEPFEGSHCEASRGMKKQKDFVKRNIELVSGEGDQVLLTQAEGERLARLLREGDEEEEDSARGADCEENMWAVSVLTGQGYTPEPSDLEQLIDIDSKIRLLSPVEEFLSVQSSYTNLNLCQAFPPDSFSKFALDAACGVNPVHMDAINVRFMLDPMRTVAKGHGSEVGWKCDGDPQPGETVLQDIKARRGLERRLQEIQQQLEVLGRSQEMTDESPGLTEDQLLGLLDDCELTTTTTTDKAQDLKTNDTTP